MIDLLKQQLQEKGALSLDIRARPGAHATKFKSMMEDGSIKIDIAAEPEHGKANAELIRFLAEEFEVSREQIEILSGHTSGWKKIHITRT